MTQGTMENVWSAAASAVGGEAWRSAVKPAKNVEGMAQIGRFRFQLFNGQPTRRRGGFGGSSLNLKGLTRRPPVVAPREILPWPDHRLCVVSPSRFA
jgi:hypothetical protein